MTPHEARIAATLQHILDQGYNRATIEVQLKAGEVMSVGGFPLRSAAKSRSGKIETYARALAVVAAGELRDRNVATLNLQTGVIQYPPREHPCEEILERVRLRAEC